MTPIDLANKYMDILFNTVNISELATILDPELEFIGPYNTFNSADDYISSLLSDPPKDFSFEVIKSFSDDTYACIIYRFTKPGVETTMAQLFESSEGIIKRIRLVYDSEAFHKQH